MEKNLPPSDNPMSHEVLFKYFFSQRRGTCVSLFVMFLPYHDFKKIIKQRLNSIDKYFL